MPAPKKFKAVTATQTVQPENGGSMANVATKMFKVRLRNETMPLPCSVQNADNSKGNIGRVSATLIPNQWTQVPECIYDMLKRKFQMRDSVSRMVPDFNANWRAPKLKAENAVIPFSLHGALETEVPQVRVFIWTVILMCF